MASVPRTAGGAPLAPAGSPPPATPPSPTSTRQSQSAEQSDWVGLGEASQLLGISHGTLRRWADEGRVAVFTTPGGHRRFSRRLLRSLLPATRTRRPSLARLGASPERIVRAYRPPRLPRAASPAPWIDALGEADRLAFRERGRAIVAILLELLDSEAAETRDRKLQEACQLAAAHGRQVGELGASMAEAVETFLQFRSPFIRELAGVARQRGLDTREATELLVEAESAMDRLLVATMTGHSLAAGPRRRGTSR